MQTLGRSPLKPGLVKPGLVKPGPAVLRMLGVLPVMAAIMVCLQGCGGSGNYAPSTPGNPSPGVTLQSIQINPVTPFLGISENRQLRAMGVYSDGGSVDVTSQVTWSSSSAANVAISSKGIVTGVSLGPAAVTASIGPVTGALQLVVDSDGFTSNTIAILSVPYKTIEVDAAYVAESQSLIQGAYAVQEVNLDADQFSSVLPVPSALLASIPMPSGFVPNVTVAIPSSALVAAISYSSPDVQIIDASNQPSDVANNTVTATFTAPVTTSVTFNGITCMICAAVINPLNNKLLLSTAQGYYSMDVTAGTFTALPFSGALPAATFTLNPIAASPYIISSTFGQNPPAAGEVQILDLTTNAVTTIATPGVIEPSATPIDLASDFAAIVDAGANDQMLLNMTDPQSPTSVSISDLGGCAPGPPMSMAALGIAASANPSVISPSLFLTQPAGSCFGFEVWIPGDNNPSDFVLIPYEYAPMPATPDGNPFLNGSDPNTISTFNSVVDKKNYAVLVDGNQNWMAKINPAVPLSFTTPGTLPVGSMIPSGDFLAGQTGDAIVYLPTPASVVTLSQVNINFANQGVGTPSGQSIVSVTNVGVNSLTPLVISQVTIQGTNAGDFSESNSCANQVLPPSGKCSINVVFTPAATGPRSATLSITDNGGASPQIVQLSGTGT